MLSPRTDILLGLSRRRTVQPSSKDMSCYSYSEQVLYLEWWMGSVALMVMAGFEAGSLDMLAALS